MQALLDRDVQLAPGKERDASRCGPIPRVGAMAQSRIASPCRASDQFAKLRGINDHDRPCLQVLREAVSRERGALGASGLSQPCQAHEALVRLHLAVSPWHDDRTPFSASFNRPQISTSNFTMAAPSPWACCAAASGVPGLLRKQGPV